MSLLNGAAMSAIIAKIRALDVDSHNLAHSKGSRHACMNERDKLIRVHGLQGIPL